MYIYLAFTDRATTPNSVHRAGSRPEMSQYAYRFVLRTRVSLISMLCDHLVMYSYVFMHVHVISACCDMLNMQSSKFPLGI